MRKWIALVLMSICISATAGGMKGSEFNDFVGQYRLADGRTLTMTFEGRRQVAEIDGRGRIEVVAISDTTFVAKDGSLQLKFDRWKNGSVTGVVVIWPRDAQASTSLFGA